MTSHRPTGKTQRRLQDYHRARYGQERLAGLSSQALLEPEQFWSAQS